MKNLTLSILLLTLTCSAFGQEYLISGDKINDYENSIIRNPKAGYGYCQINQITLLDKMINQTKRSINQVALELEEGHRLKTDRMTMTLYSLNLYKQIMGQISLVKMKQQLKTQGLYNLMTATKGSMTKSVLNLDNMTVDIEKEITESLERSLDKNVWSRLPKTSAEFIEKKATDKLLETLVDKSFKALVRNQVRAQITQYLAGNLSQHVINQAVKSTLLKLGKDILIDIGRGALIEIVTLPLHAYTLPPEGEYLENVKIVPEFLLNPEWIRTEKNLEPPTSIWRNHCLLLSRRPETVEHYMDQLLKKKRIEAAQKLSRIEEHKMDPDWRKVRYEKVK